MKLLFEGKTAIITGAANGLGKIYALELAKRGANLVINDLPPSTHSEGVNSAHDLVQYINSNGGKAIASYHNVVNGDHIVKDCLKAFNRVDILINNAGILRDKSFAKLQKEDWHNVLNIHLNGTFEMCHAVFPLMQMQSFGRIITIGSGAGLYGNFGQTNYSAAKMGIIGLTNTLAIEGMKYNINANCVVPVAASKMTESILPVEILEKLKPEHISSIVTYLSHESCSETGGIFECGGGYYSRIKLQRSEGVVLGDNESVATAEMIQESMNKINDFGVSSSPTTLAESLRGMLASVNSKPNTTSNKVPINTTDAITETESSDSFLLESDSLFTKMNDFFANNHDRALEVMEDVNAKVIFAINANANDLQVKQYFVDLTTSTGTNKSIFIKVLSSDDLNNSKYKPHLKLYCSDNTFISLSTQKISPEIAYMRGLLKIKGNMGIAVRVRSLLNVVSYTS